MNIEEGRQLIIASSARSHSVDAHAIQTAFALVRPRLEPRREANWIQQDIVQIGDEYASLSRHISESAWTPEIFAGHRVALDALDVLFKPVSAARISRGRSGLRGQWLTRRSRMLACQQTASQILVATYMIVHKLVKRILKANSDPNVRRQLRDLPDPRDPRRDREQARDWPPNPYIVLRLLELAAELISARPARPLTTPVESTSIDELARSEVERSSPAGLSARRAGLYSFA